MIRYHISPQDLQGRAAAAWPRWTEAARLHTLRLMAEGKFSGPSDWSRVKPAFMQLQNFKCGYCETMLQSGLKGTIAHDLEHFRPKNTVRSWPKMAEWGQPDTSLDNGYYWLAYTLENYLASCKICNSTSKAVFFPVTRQRAQPGQGSAQLLAEEPLLCHPLSLEDTPPEQLIAFDATVAIPHPASSPTERRRAEAMIELFGLNTRDDLHRSRAQMLVLLAPYLERRQSGHARHNDDSVISACLSGKLAHTACCRAFDQLWLRDAVRATAIWEACEDVLAQDPLSPG